MTHLSPEMGKPAPGNVFYTDAPQYPSSSTYYGSHNQIQTDGQEYNSEGMNIKQTLNGGGACFCGKVFSTYNYCRVHYIQVHGEETEYKHLICLICNYTFAYDLNLKNHLKKEHAISEKLSLVEGSNDKLAQTESGGGVCLVCSKKFSTLNYCKVHFRSKHGAMLEDNEVYQNIFDSSQEEQVYPGPSGYPEIDPGFPNPYSGNNPNHGYEYTSYSQTFDGHSSNSEKIYLNSNGHVGEYVEYVKGEYVQNNEVSHLEGYNDLIESQEVQEERTSTHANVSDQPPNSLKRTFENSNMGMASSDIQFKHQISPVNSPQKGGGRIKVTKTSSGGGYCEVCGKIYSRIDTARSHYVQVHGEDEEITKHFNCLLCNFGFSFEVNLGSHMKQLHGITGKLQLCEGSDGKLAKTESGGGVCLVCGAKYSRMDTLKSHFKAKHENLVVDDKFQSPGKKRKMEPFVNFYGQEKSNQDVSNGSEECATSVLSTAQPTFNNISDEPSELDQERSQTIPGIIQGDTTTSSVRMSETVSPLPMIRPVDVNLLKAQPNPSLVHINQEIDCTAKESNSCHNPLEIKITATESGGGICLICHTTFSIYGNCKAHYIKKHGEDDGNGTHLCLVCEKKFNFQQNLKDHLKAEHGIYGTLTRFQEHGDGYYLAKIGTDGGVCLICKQVFTIFGNLKAHFSKKHGAAQHTPDHKPMKLPTVHPPGTMQRSKPSPIKPKLNNPVPRSNETSITNKHLIETKNNTTPASHCMKNIDPSPDPHGLHIEPEIQVLKTESGGGICLVCNKEFSQYGNGKVHYITKHGEDGTGNLNCLMCQARFNFRSSFKEHMSTKHKVTGNLQRCDEQGSGESMMAKDEKGGGACLICSKYFSQYGNLKVHFNKKHGHG